MSHHAAGHPIICSVMVEFITSHTHRPAQIWLHTSQQINCVVASNDSYINADGFEFEKE